MNLTLSVPRTFRRSKYIPTWSKSQPSFESGDSKAQHILGLSEEDMRLARNNSVGSSSTARIHGSNFSEATTAPVLAVHITEHTKEDLPPVPNLQAKASSILLGEENAVQSSGAPDTCSQSGKLRSQTSASTLQSYYDKSKAPLNVSQQTSESSTRDFALRKGSASAITSRSEEMEHARQIRLFSSSKDRKKSESKNKLSKSPARPTTTPSHVTTEPAVNPPQVGVEPDDSFPTQPNTSLGNVSVVSTRSRGEPASSPGEIPMRKSRSKFAPVQPIAQHPEVKIHVRRPKAGTKHWFDSLDDDFSDEEVTDEPALDVTFVSEVQEAFQNDRIGQSKQQVTPKQSTAPAVSASSPRTSYRRVSEPTKERAAGFPTRTSSLNQSSHAQKTDPFQKVNLNVQSALNLSSSDDEEDDDLSPLRPVPEAKPKVAPRNSVLSEISIDDESEIEVGLAQAVYARSRAAVGANKTINQTDSSRSGLLKVPSRSSSKLGTYYNDKSSENVQSGDDIMSSFPATPTDHRSTRRSPPRNSDVADERNPERFQSAIPYPSRRSAKRESIISNVSNIDSEAATDIQRDSVLSDDEESIISTRIMTVTRQEENLIAAMRIKRAAMRRAEALANRESALQLLELGGLRKSRELYRPSSVYGDVLYSRAKAAQSERDSLQRFSHRRSRSGDLGFRPDSVTTIQTSIPDRSVRNSQATFMTDLSDELQLPYSTYTASAAAMVPSSLRRVDTQLPNGRDSRQSTTTDESSKNRSSNRDTRISRDSHVVALDPLERKLLREEIPSQLFMERPFLGWEARANLETAAH